MSYSLSLVGQHPLWQQPILFTFFFFPPACKIHVYSCDLCRWTGSHWAAQYVCMSCRSALWCLFSHQERRAEEGNSHSCSSFSWSINHILHVLKKTKQQQHGHKMSVKMISTVWQQVKKIIETIWICGLKKKLFCQTAVVCLSPF